MVAGTPKALQQLFGNYSSYTMVDLTYLEEVRLQTNVWGKFDIHKSKYVEQHVGPSGSELRLQYSLTMVGPWSYFTSKAKPAVSLSTAGPRDSGWVKIPTAAKAPVYLRLATINGNGKTRIGFGLTVIHGR
jgi:hypothetical protein